MPRARRFFVLLMLPLLAAPAWASTPTILPCHQDRVLALLDPYGGQRDIVPGWRCTGISLSDVIAIALTRGDQRIDLTLHDPGWNGTPVYTTTNYRIAVSASPNVSATDVASVGSTVAQVIAGNDRESLWYETAYSPFQIERGSTCVAPRAQAVVAVLLLALAAVGLHWLFAARRSPGGDSLPSLSPREWGTLAALTLCAAVAYALPTCLRFVRYGNKSADLGIYAHSFWNAWQGHGLFNSPEGLDHLSSHASPGLYLLVPFYALAPSPATLLVLNAIALVSGAIPAYLIARRRFAPTASLLCAAIYLLNPALSSLSYDIHEVTFAVPLLLWALLFLQCGRGGLMLLMLLLAMSWKENVGVTAFFIGAYVLVMQRRVHLGLAVMLLGLAWASAGINLIVPYFGGSHANKTMMRYAALGNDWTALLLSPVLRPAAFFGTVISVESAQYLFKVFSPFGFVPLLSPAELLMATPTFAESILDGPGELRSGLYHYEALLLPVLYVAFVGGMARLATLAPKPARLTVAALVLILMSQPLYRSAGRGWLADLEGDPARAEIDAIVARIPAGVSVISPQTIQPHLSDRKVSAYFREEGDLRGDYPAFDFAVVPAVTQPPRGYEAVLKGETYSLFRRSIAGELKGSRQVEMHENTK